MWPSICCTATTPAEHEQRRDRPLVDQRHRDRGDAADRGTDDRDESTDEDKDRQGQDQRQSEDPGDQRDAKRVGQRDDEGASHIGGEHRPGALTAAVHPVASRLGEQ